MAVRNLLRLFKSRPQNAPLPSQLSLTGNEPNSARYLETAIRDRGYDEQARQALRRQARDFVEYQQERLGGLNQSAFDIAFFADDSALIIYASGDGHVLQATSSEEAEARLQDEKEVSSRFARNWRQPA